MKCLSAAELGPRPKRADDWDSKTEGGDVFVNLGLRLRLRDGFIDCPPPKRRILLRDLGAWHSSVQRLEPFERKTAERQRGVTHTGRALQSRNPP